MHVNIKMETFEGQTNFIFHSALLGFYSILEKYNGFFEIRNVFKKTATAAMMAVILILVVDVVVVCCSSSSSSSSSSSGSSGSGGGSSRSSSSVLQRFIKSRCKAKGEIIVAWSIVYLLKNASDRNFSSHRRISIN